MAVRVRFLGCGDAFNERAQCHACHLVQTPSAMMLLDCGPTTLLTFKREGLSAKDVDYIFLSHLHGDHFAGVPFVLLACIYDTPRTKPLTVVGPPGTERRIAELYHALYPDISQRPLPYEYRCIETAGGENLQLGDVVLRGFQVPHQENDISLGLRVSVDGKNILYSGDTGWTEALVEQSADTDLFICECCFWETHVDFHLDYPTIAANRHRFGTRRLMLTHIGREVVRRLDEVDCEITSDGMTLDL